MARTTIEITDIITRVDLADLLGYRPQYINVLLARNTDNFPQPILTTRQGMLFSRAEVVAWAKRTGRLE